MTYHGLKQKKYAQEHYQKNKLKYRLRDRKRKTKATMFVRRYKKLRTVVCVDCGEGRWQCLDFHHINPEDKSQDVNRMVKDRCTLRRIKTEIRKCIVVCANCHRMRHHGSLT